MRSRVIIHVHHINVIRKLKVLSCFRCDQHISSVILNSHFTITQILISKWWKLNSNQIRLLEFDSLEMTEINEGITTDCTVKWHSCCQGCACAPSILIRQWNQSWPFLVLFRTRTISEDVQVERCDNLNFFIQIDPGFIEWRTADRDESEQRCGSAST